MSFTSLLIIDDFYGDPDSIRKLALESEFVRRKDAPYPGKESIILNPIWDATLRRIASYLQPYEKVKLQGHPAYPQGKFHLALAQDSNIQKVGVHSDIAKWSAVIYLSKIDKPMKGTSWYQHIPTQQYQSSSSYLSYMSNLLLEKKDCQRKDIILSHSRDKSLWLETQTVEMKYNRLVIFRADYFHSVNNLFGECTNTGRLSQHFILY